MTHSRVHLATGLSFRPKTMATVPGFTKKMRKKRKRQRRKRRKRWWGTNRKYEK